ncbi:MAG: translation initiation factor IF-2 [Candidatus Omnitrophica bacterium]|nr:translation initiation factor IF-2 [Candidatus Omnitrophota bacterium]
MLVKDLAKELNITEEVILSTLKALKLRAKGDDQEISTGVVSVVKGELENKGLIVKQEEKKPVAVKKPVVKKAPAVESEEKPAPKKKAAVAKPKAKAEEAEVVAPKKETIIRTASQRAELPKPPQPVVEVKPVPAPVVVVAPAVKLPNELAEFERPADPATDPAADPAKKAGTTVIRKVVKTIIRKVVPKEQPEFISVKPLAKKREEERAAIALARADHGKAVPGSEQAGESAAAAPVALKREGPLQNLEIKVPVTVGDLAFKIQQKANVVLKALMGMGLFAHINQNLGEDVARKICEEFGFNLVEAKSQEEQLIHDHSKEEDPALLKHRAPVVTFMGHVDHGKTSLLDCIRKTKVVDTEHGGITQHIRAYSVTMPKGSITFLDTPGHAAFTAMRSRGAHITDVVVLVIAANEGIMPQTEEAIDHAKAAGVKIVVALNKMDRQDADPERVKKQLLEHDLMPEEWGGKTVIVPVSATTGQGIDTLLEMILLEAELLELKANPAKLATGIVVEAHLSTGRGALATIIIQGGTLHEGDILVVGPYYGKIKAMFDDRKRNVKEAGPSMPVEILGLPSVPDAGEKFFVAENEKTAREIASVREEKVRAERLRATSKITLEDLFAQKEAGEVRELNIVIKADVQGSVEALRQSLAKIAENNKEVRIKFVHCGVGGVNASDIILAHVSKAIIIAFGVNTTADASAELEKTPVDVRKYNVIYAAVDEVKAALEGLLKPDTKRHFVARAEVRQVFNLSKSGLVAGCFMLKGRMRNKALVDIQRNGEVVHTGKVQTLKRFKDDVKEVGEGFECGIAVEGFTAYQAGDIIEAFQIEEIARKL